MTSSLPQRHPEIPARMDDSAMTQQGQTWMEYVNRCHECAYDERARRAANASEARKQRASRRRRRRAG